MNRACDSCGVAYEAQRATSRFCSTKCRVRASRGAQVVALPPHSSDAEAEHPVIEAVRSELEQAGRLSSAVGQMALDAARRVANSRDTGSSYAGLLREARATLADAMRGASDPKSSVSAYKDELAARRGA